MRTDRPARPVAAGASLYRPPNTTRTERQSRRRASTDRDEATAITVCDQSFHKPPAASHTARHRINRSPSRRRARRAAVTASCPFRRRSSSDGFAPPTESDARIEAKHSQDPSPAGLVPASAVPTSAPESSQRWPDGGTNPASRAQGGPCSAAGQMPAASRMEGLSTTRRECCRWSGCAVAGPRPESNRPGRAAAIGRCLGVVVLGGSGHPVEGGAAAWLDPSPTTRGSDVDM